MSRRTEPCRRHGLMIRVQPIGRRQVHVVLSRASCTSHGSGSRPIGIERAQRAARAWLSRLSVHSGRCEPARIVFCTSRMAIASRRLSVRSDAAASPIGSAGTSRRPTTSTRRATSRSWRRRSAHRRRPLVLPEPRRRVDPRPTSPQVPRASSRVRPSKTDRDQLRGDHVVFVQATPLMRPTSSSPQLQLSTPTRSRPTTTNLGQQCGTRRARPRCLAAPRVALLLPEGAVSSSVDKGRSLTLGAIDQISGSLDRSSRWSEWWRRAESNP